MPAIMSDQNIEGQFNILLGILQSADWRELWGDLGFDIATFESLGLPANASDLDVWRRCQEEDVLLITGNRSEHSPDSLESTIRALNQASSLPVLTISDPDQVHQNRAYAWRVVERLMEYLIDVETIRGAGRLYLP